MADPQATPSARAQASAGEANLSATKRAYAYVSDRIVNGEYPPGELISEAQVAAAAGVSRTPVREAFVMLGRDGWLRVYPKRGAVVVPVTFAEVDDLFEVRSVLEPWIIRRIITNGVSAPTVQALRDTLEATRGAMDIPISEFRGIAQEFHRILARATGNALLAEITESLLLRQLRVGASPVLPEESPHAAWRLRLLAEHEGLLDAIVDGDIDRAVHLSNEHLRLAQQRERRPTGASAP
jgi:DNA-binding GntR family transcriptional regulator